MGSHYFDQSPHKASEEKTIEAVLRGNKWMFTSDHAVFSKKEIDFGSKTLIEAFRWPEVDGDVLDVGCGYGPIGITLASETSRNVWLVDVNTRALALAEKNVSRYHLNNVHVQESDLFERIQRDDFAAIVTNPPIRAGKDVVFDLYEKAHQYLRSRGELWVVIQKKQGAPSTKEKLLSLFSDVETVKKNKGYHVFCAKKS
ncbi:16S rRNA m(2)G 1207 methyltransferase [Alteribacillus persepolensis]|uniref:16S rRNA m(2)G 1207 methyltransferase n=1 Tax=Alteribacillus persepolensis TaxID=568899 RepID=A0A1G8HJ16_9BACI|nr:methyltransferase [Alteribacillus persepolensis]SDI06585.1 16S rRNA m(2)G 1207 methyltransferase [Alteribacillus persepolensis]